MINIERDVKEESLNKKLKIADYMKKLTHFVLLTDLLLYFSLEILIIINLANLEHIKIIPIFLRV